MPGRALDADVIVVGAGLAGLSAADALRRRGRRPLVVEVRSEAGGRTLSRPLGGRTVDLGGEWVGRRHRRVMRLVAELGLELEPAGQLGAPVKWRLPGHPDSVGRLPPAGSRADVARAMWRAGRLARHLDVFSPWQSPAAAELDSISFGDWLAGFAGPPARALFSSLVGALASAPVEEVSLLHVLWWLRRGGGPVGALRSSFESRIEQGAQALAAGLAGRLGGGLLLGERVLAVEQNGGVRVHTQGGAVIAGHRAILATSVRSLPGIEFDPPLPPDLRALSSIRVDPGTKVTAELEGEPPAYSTVLGRRTLWGAWRSGGRLTGFCPPPECDLPDARLVEDLGDAFGVPPQRLQDVTFKRWRAEESIPGCDVAFAPGELTRHGPSLRSPHGRVDFAGVERSSWPNNMEGALESGEQAAARSAARI